MLGSRGAFARRSTAAFVLASLVAISRPALADGDESDERRMQAQTLYEQGVKLETSDPKAALSAFRASYDIQPNYRALYKVGRVCLTLGDKDCAQRSFEQYLREGAGEIPAKRRKEIEKELKSLGARNAATLTIKSTVTGAFVKVDGSVVGKTPLSQPIPVSAGSHTVVLVVDGSVIEKSVTVSAGGSETVELEPKKEDPASPSAVTPATEPTSPTEGSASPAPPPEPAPAHAAAPAPAPTTRSFPVVPWIVAGAFATGTIVSGILTAGASSDYEAIKERYPVSRESLEDAHGKGRDLLLLTSVLGAVTVVSVGVASYFTFFRGDAPGGKSVSVAVGPNGISIRGRLP